VVSGSDISRLACDPLPHHRFDAVGGRRVDPGAESFGEVFFQLHEGEEADRPGELRPAMSMSLAGVCSPRETEPETPVLARWKWAASLSLRVARMARTFSLGCMRGDR